MTRRVLVVFCHPVRTSLIGAALDRVLAGLRGAGHEVRLVDLYAEDFDPALSLAGHHDLLVVPQGAACRRGPDRVSRGFDELHRSARDDPDRAAGALFPRGARRPLRGGGAAAGAHSEGEGRASIRFRAGWSVNRPRFCEAGGASNRSEPHARDIALSRRP